MDFPYSCFATSVNYRLNDNSRLRDMCTETWHLAFPLNQAAITTHKVLHKKIIAIVVEGMPDLGLEDRAWRIETNLAVRLHTTLRSIAYHACTILDPFNKGTDPARLTIPEFPSCAKQARLFGGIQMTLPPFFLTICPDMVDKFNPYIAIGTFMGIQQLLDMVQVHANKCLAWHDTLFARLKNRTNPTTFRPIQVCLNYNDNQVGDSEPMVVRLGPTPILARFIEAAPPPDYESFREDAYTHSSYTFNRFSIAIGTHAKSARMWGKTDHK